MCRPLRPSSPKGATTRQPSRASPREIGEACRAEAGEDVEYTFVGGPSSPKGATTRQPSLASPREIGVACRAEAGEDVEYTFVGGPSSPKGATTRQPSRPSPREIGVACRAEAGEASEGWWSQAGSNRRPRHCERRALPAELWPHRGRVEVRRRPAIGAIADFLGHLPGTSLVWAGGNRYLAGSRIRDRTPRE